MKRFASIAMRALAEQHARSHTSASAALRCIHTYTDAGKLLVAMQPGLHILWMAWKCSLNPRSEQQQTGLILLRVQTDKWPFSLEAGVFYNTLQRVAFFYKVGLRQCPRKKNHWCTKSQSLRYWSP